MISVNIMQLEKLSWDLLVVNNLFKNLVVFIKFNDVIQYM